MAARGPVIHIEAPVSGLTVVKWKLCKMCGAYRNVVEQLYSLLFLRGGGGEGYTSSKNSSGKRSDTFFWLDIPPGENTWVWWGKGRHIRPGAVPTIRKRTQFSAMKVSTCIARSLSHTYPKTRVIFCHVVGIVQVGRRARVQTDSS